MYEKNQINLQILILTAVLFGWIFLVSGCQSAPEIETPPTIGKGDWEEVRRRLAAIIEKEMAQNGVVGLSVALIEDQQTIWAQGFG